MNKITDQQAYKMMEILAEIYARQHGCEARIVERPQK